MNAPREQGIRLDWPKVKPQRGPFLRRCIGGLCIVIALSLMGTWLWLTTGLVSSGNAVVDGRTYTITARLTDTVSQVLVQAGQNVAAGQPLLRLSGLNYQAALPEARQRVQAVRPPSLEETAERVAKAEAIETSMVQRAAIARSEETTSRKLVEDAVAAHVKAQLALRSMDAQGQQKQAAYTRAVQAEAEARRTMDAVRAAADQASRARVAVEAELERVRRELAAYAVEHGARSAARSTEGQAPPASSGSVADDATVVTAPVAGRIVAVQAVAGQRVDRGQAVVQLVPADANEMWIVASFAEQDIAQIHPGQVCTIRLEAYAGQVLQGEVEAIMPASEAIMQLLHPREQGNQGEQGQAKNKIGAAASGTRIPVRIRFVVPEGQTLPELFLGMGGSVKVQTRNVPAFLARWL